MRQAKYASINLLQSHQSTTAPMSTRSHDILDDNFSSSRDDRTVTTNDGPTSESQRLEESDGIKTVRVPRLNLGEFCQQYGVGESIRATLEREGFKTAGALAEISEDTLKEANLKIGEIGELKRAVREFLSNAMIDVNRG